MFFIDNLIKRLSAFINKPLKDKVRSLSHRLYKIDNSIFEKYFNFDFHGDVACNDLISNSKLSAENACDYHPYGNPTFRYLVDEALAYKPNIKHFVDIGCGKGKQLVYAKRYFKFNLVEGIDFSPPLVKIAVDNIKKYRRKNVAAYCIDACDYRLPDEECIVFLFNPFNNKILQIFILNNIEHFKKHSSIVAYANDLNRDVFENFGFKIIHRSQRERNSILIYKS